MPSEERHLLRSAHHDPARYRTTTYERPGRGCRRYARVTETEALTDAAMSVVTVCLPPALTGPHTRGSGCPVAAGPRLRPDDRVRQEAPVPAAMLTLRRPSRPPPGGCRRGG